jgi:hypothetical protein
MVTDMTIATALPYTTPSTALSSETTPTSFGTDGCRRRGSTVDSSLPPYLGTSLSRKTGSVSLAAAL